MHYYYNIHRLDWQRWRLCYEGGDEFISVYLRKWARESYEDFERRRQITAYTNVAQELLDEVISRLAQRFDAINRVGGSAEYQEAMAGRCHFGDDGLPLGMNTFLTEKILPELLPFGRVGVLIDAPVDPDPSRAGRREAIPYMVVYRAEDILDWSYTGNRLSAVLLRHIEQTAQGQTNTYYKYITAAPGGFVLGSGDTPEAAKAAANRPEAGFFDTQFPFILLTTRRALMHRLDRLCIQLLNIESIDARFLIEANFPHYVEQGSKRNAGFFDTAEGGTEREVGSMHGTLYPPNTNQPGYIAPPTDPLHASMAKQEQIKREMRRLVGLNLTAEAARATGILDKEREADYATFARYGEILQAFEAQVASIYAAFLGDKEVAKAIYPTEYTLTTTEEGRKEAKEILDMVDKVPLMSARQEMIAVALRRLLGPYVDPLTLQSLTAEAFMNKELHCDQEALRRDAENGSLSRATYAKYRFYPEGDAAVAQAEHVERLARMAAAQALGNVSGVESTEQKKVTQDPDRQPDGVPGHRGEGK